VVCEFTPGGLIAANCGYIDLASSLQPYTFGILVADLVHDAAQAYAQSFGIEEAEAFCAITQGLQAELACPTKIAGLGERRN
jgi:hypothetical protein